MGDAQQPLSITFTACVAWSGAAWEKVKNPIYRALPCRKRPYCEQHWAISAWGRWEPGEEKEVGGEDTQALKRHPKAEMSELTPTKSPVGWHQRAQKPRGKAEDEQDKEVRTKRGVPSPLLWGGRRWMLPNTATPEEDTAGNQHQQETELKAMEIKEEETLPLHPLPPPPAPALPQPCGGLSSFPALRPTETPHVLQAPCPKNAAADGNHHHRLQPPRVAFLFKARQPKSHCLHAVSGQRAALRGAAA